MFSFLRMPRLAALVMLLASVYTLPAQNAKPIAAQIALLRQNGANFTIFSPFTPLDKLPNDVKRIAPYAQMLTPDAQQLEAIYNQRPEAIQLLLPYHGIQLKIDLFRVDLTTTDFRLQSSDPNGLPFYEEGLHYRGAVQGDDFGVAAVSFLSDGVMGLISDSRRDGNLVLGKMPEENESESYVLYADEQLKVRNPFHCQAEDFIYEPKDLDAALETQPEVVGGCVRVYWEGNYHLFQQKGGFQGTVNYLTGVFNQVATLYANESINMRLSQLFVWTTIDPYSATSSSSALNTFRTLRTNFNADLAHLVTTGPNNIGGIAFVNTLCMNGANYAFSCISSTYNSVPTYSWTVEVITHETGHNLGSNHTQWCGWPGGPIDNCVSPEGSCSPGPSPVNGGTIMSYCHLTANGINFSHGFGPLPGNLIRNRVSQSTCLAVSCPPVNPCNPVTTITVSNITATGASVSWTGPNGASGFTLQWRAFGTSAWTSLSNPANPCILSNLPSSKEIEVRIQTVCSTGNSDFLYGVIFKTGAGSGGGAGCAAPANLSVSTGVSTATASWSAVAGAISYQLAWRLTSSSTWSSTVTTANTSYLLTGLSGGQSYQLRVATQCSGQNSVFSYLTFTMPGGGSGGSCAQPTNFTVSQIQSNNVRLSWTASSGALNYELQIRRVGFLTWSVFAGLPVTSVRVLGLLPNTSYEARVRSNCGGINTSPFTPTLTFTTTASSPAASVMGTHALERTISIDGQDLHLAPNPTAGNTRIWTDETPETPVEMEIIDQFGRVLQQQTFTGDSDIDLNGLPAGLYFVRMQAEHPKMERLIKL